MTQIDIGRHYQEIEVRGASSLDCTIQMYDLAITDLRKAVDCLGSGDIEGRTAALVHCLDVLEQLQLNLQMDTGGEAAQQLYHFYSLARAKVLEAQLKCNRKLLEEIGDAFSKVRVMWVEVRRNYQPVALVNEPWAQPSADVDHGRSAWSA